MTRFVMWDLEGTMLESVVDHRYMKTNATAKSTLQSLRRDGYANFAIEPVPAEFIRQRAVRAGLDDCFDGYYDCEQGCQKSKCISKLRKHLRNPGDKWLADNGIFIGNSLKYGHIRDVEGLVHIINPYSMRTDFVAYEQVIEALSQTNPRSMRKAFEELSGQNAQFRYDGLSIQLVQGVELDRVKNMIVFSQRPSYSRKHITS